ncbi:MAG: hypothetical protein NUW37_15000 [Planctomycetes bacterium]|nr:hypothetical protein [Planctomycetota bacterium]
MNRIAFITNIFSEQPALPRELFALSVANVLAERNSVEVFTTTAVDDVTYESVYSEGRTVLPGKISVRRFPAYARRIEEVRRLESEAFSKSRTKDDELRWLRAKGPICDELTAQFLKEQREFDRAWFFGSLCPLTYLIARDLTIPFEVVPFRSRYDDGVLEVEKEIAAKANRLHFSLPDEIDLLAKMLDVSRDKCGARFLLRESDIPGENSTALTKDSGRFAETFQIHRPFAFAVAPFIDRAKSHDFVSFFRTFRNEFDSRLKLVVVGKSIFDSDLGAGIVSVERAEYRKILTLLSMCETYIELADSSYRFQTVLAALRMKKPVLCSSRAELASAFVRNSGAGLTFGFREEFEEALRFLESNPEVRAELGAQGQRAFDGLSG